jgi:hypothetical protein
LQNLYTHTETDDHANYGTISKDTYFFTEQQQWPPETREVLHLNTKLKMIEASEGK